MRLSNRARRWFAWWYVSIGAGFVLLAVHRWLIGESGWLIALRLVIAAGFFVLGWMELRAVGGG